MRRRGCSDCNDFAGSAAWNVRDCGRMFACRGVGFDPSFQQSLFASCWNYCMSYLIVFAGLLGVTLYLDLTMVMSIGIILMGMTIWAVLMNRRLNIPKW